MDEQSHNRPQGDAEPEVAFDAFISYSREDVDFARVLEKALQRFRPPKGLGLPRRRLRVFRDEEDLVGTVLGDALTGFLKRSRKLLLICSPAARRSKYVDLEITRFAREHDPRDVVPVLFRGRPNREFEAGEMDDRAFPAALEELAKEPLAVDYRGFTPGKDKPHQGHYRNAWYTLLANLLDIERNDLERRDFRRQRRERSIIASIVALVVASLATFGAVAWVQKKRAGEQRDIALAGLAVNLAVKSRSLMESSPAMSLLVAAEAASLTAETGRPAVPEARQALRDALAVTGGDRVVTLADEVVAIGFDATAESVYAVGGDGVRWWDVESGEPCGEVSLAGLWPAAEAAPPRIAVSADGSRLAATTAESTWTVDLGDRDSAPTELDGPGQEIASLVIGEGGRWLAVLSESGALLVRDLSGDRGWQAVTELPALPPGESPADVQVRISADESILYLSDAARMLHLWSLRDGVASLGTVPDFQLPPDRLAVGPGGAPIALARWREPLTLYSPDEERPAPTLGGGEIATERVRFSPDGRWLVAVDDRRVFAWDTGDLAAPPHAWELTDPAGSEIAFSPDSRRFAAAELDGTVWVWDLRWPDHEPEQRGRHRGSVESVAFSPDGQWLVSVDRSETVVVSDVDDDLGPPATVGVVSAIDRFAVSSDSRWLATGGPGALRLISLASPFAGSRIVRGVEPELEITAERSRSGPGFDSLSVISTTPYGRLGSAAAFSADGRWFATLGEGGDVLLADREAHRAAARRLGGLDEVTAVAFDPTSAWLVAGGLGDELLAWNVGDLAAEPLRLGRIAPPGESSVACLAFSPDGRWLAAGAGLGESEVWSWPAAAAAEPIALEGHRGWVLGVEFSSGGDLLATVGEHAAQVWDVGELTAPLARFEIPQGYSAARLIPGRRALVTGGVDGIARIWEIDRPGEPPVELRGHSSAILNLAVDPEGRRLATVSEDAVMLWHLEGAQSAPLRELDHNRAVAAVFGSPEELITAGGDYHRVWNLADRSEPPIVLEARDRLPVWLGVGPRSESVASVGLDGTARLWPLGTARLIEIVCAMASTNLEYRIWREAFGDRPYEKTCPGPPPHPSLVAAGRAAAEDGDFERAVELLARAVELQDDLDFDPEREAREVAVRSMLERGKRLARDNKTAAASVQFERAKALAPEAAPDPVPMANRLAAAQVHLSEGRELARRGRIEAAVAHFITARGVDPEIEVDPLAEAGKLAAPGLMERARGAAWAGKIEDAVEIYQRVLALDPARDFDPRAEASRHAAVSLRLAAEKLAEDAKIDEAIARFESALALDPTLEIDPRAEALRRAAPRLARQALTAVKEGRVAEGMAQIRRVRQADPELEITSNCWNQLCWHGALWGEAARVAPACAAALELEPENGGYRDSRGVQRALVGDLDGARADFEAYVSWAPDNGGDEEQIELRRRWIASLDAGHNPITPAQVAELREAERNRLWIGRCTR